MKKIYTKVAAGLGALACLMTMTAGLAACSSENEEPKQDDGRKLRQLTIENVALTRATLTDNGSTLGAAWEARDNEATYMNLTGFALRRKMCGYLTSSSNAGTSTFTGSVYCDAGDKLALIYPAKDESKIGSDGSYRIELSGQTGTLSDIAQRYHYVYGTGTVTSVTGETASGTISSMKSLLAVCKFTFKDGSGNPVPVKTLKISYGEDLSVGYPLSGSVIPAFNSGEVTATPDAPSEATPLAINLDSENAAGEVYVALFPCGSSSEKVTFYFSVTGSNVTGSNGTYTGTANAYLIAGRFYPVTITLTQQS